VKIFKKKKNNQNWKIWKKEKIMKTDKFEKKNRKNNEIWNIWKKRRKIMKRKNFENINKK